MEEIYRGRVPENSVIVFGDNVVGTIDSTVFGVIGFEEIIGTADTPTDPQTH